MRMMIQKKNSFHDAGHIEHAARGGLKELKDETFERICVIKLDSPPIYEGYLEKHSQGNKFGLYEDKVIYTKMSP